MKEVFQAESYKQDVLEVGQMGYQFKELMWEVGRAEWFENSSVIKR